MTFLQFRGRNGPRLVDFRPFLLSFNVSKLPYGKQHSRQEVGEAWAGLPLILCAIWAGSQRRSNISLVISDAASPAFCS